MKQAKKREDPPAEPSNPVPSEETKPEVKPSDETKPEVKPIEETKPEVKPSEETKPEVKPSEETKPEVKPIEGAKSEDGKAETKSKPTVLPIIVKTPHIVSPKISSVDLDAEEEEDVEIVDGDEPVYQVSRSHSTRERIAHRYITGLSFVSYRTC